MMKKFFVMFLFLFSILIFSTAAAYAENLYVRPEGQTYGTGDGSSWDNAFSGFSSVLWGDGTGHVGAGDTLYISGGSSTGSATYAQTLDIGASGTSTNLITIKIDTGNSEHNGLVIIDANLVTGVNGIRINSCSYIKVDGYNAAKPDGIGIDVCNAAAGSPGVLVEAGGSHNVIRYIDSHHNNTYSISLEGDGGYNLVEYCKAHDNYGSAGKHGIRFGNDSYNTLQYCKSYDNEGQGFLASESSNHTIIYNKF